MAPLCRPASRSEGMMRKAAGVWTLCVVAVATGLLCYSRLAADTKDVEDVAVIVSPRNAVQSLTLNELTKIYRGERQYWRTNLPVVILFRAPGTHEREVVLRTIFQMTET